MTNSLAPDLDEVLEETPGYWDELRGQRLFVTGGTGFFGCWLLETFTWINDRLRLGAQAVVLTRNPERLREQAPHLAEHTAIQFHRGDIRDFRFPEGDFSHVIHAATETSAALNSQAPKLMIDTIIQGTSRCLEFAQSRGARKFLFTSSGAVYGAQPSDLAHLPETYCGSPDPLSPTPVSAYGEAKRAAELQCAMASHTGGMEVKIARCFAFVGPYMKLDQHFAIGNFILNALQGGPVKVKGDGTSLRSYLYAADLMVWLWTILFRGANCRAYNVGSEETVSISKLAHLVARLVSPAIAVEIAEKATGEPATRYVPCTKRACSELGLQQRTSLSDAVQKTMDWIRTTGALEPVQMGASGALPD